MREQIIHRLASTRPAADPVAAALADIPAGAEHVWFKLPLRPAAVLLPLIERDHGLALLLTERTHDLPDHPGQVALPGGRVEAGDANMQATALRESHEEIGLHPDIVSVVGFVPAQPVITGYAVVPVVGFIDGPFEPVLDVREVGALFEVPLEYFLDERNCTTRAREREGVSIEVWEYQWEEHRIWGATAKIIREFLRIIQ